MRIVNSNHIDENENAVEKLRYLESLIGDLASEKVARLESENESIKKINDELAKEIKSLNEQIDVINQDHHEELEKLTKAHNDGRERQRGKWEADISDLKITNSNLTIQNKKKETQIVEMQAAIEKKDAEIVELKHSLEKEFIKVETLQSMDEKLDTVIREIISISDLIKDSMSKNISSDEILSTVNKRIESITERDERIKNECERIYELTEQKYKVKDIAEILGYGKRIATVSERKNSKQYKEVVARHSNIAQ